MGSAIDRNAKTASRLMRNQQRLRGGGLTRDIGLTSPLIYNTTTDKLVLTLASAGGLETAASALQIKLNGTALALSASGLAVALATNPGLVISSGLKLLLNDTALSLGASGLATNATSANTASTIMKRGASGEYAAGTATITGNLILNTAGNGIQIKEGTNATMGVATLVAGTVVVNTTKVTATSRIFLTTDGGTLTNLGSVYISARTAATSFTISSTNVLDASDVAWVILEPA